MQEVNGYLQRINSLDDFFRLLKVDETTAEVIYDIACHVPGFPPPEILSPVLNRMRPTFNDSNPICEDGVINGIVSLGLMKVRAFFSLRTHMELCRSVKML